MADQQISVGQPALQPLHIGAGGQVDRGAEVDAGLGQQGLEAKHQGVALAVAHNHHRVPMALAARRLMTQQIRPHWCQPGQGLIVKARQRGQESGGAIGPAIGQGLTAVDQAVNPDAAVAAALFQVHGQPVGLWGGLGCQRFQ